MTPRSIALTFGVVISVAGCAKPNELKIYKSPDPQVFLTAETFYGEGAISSDNLRLYANLEHGGKLDRLLVLEGNLSVKEITWVSNDRARICLSDGFSETYRNIAPLSADGMSKNIRIDIVLPCERPN